MTLYMVLCVCMWMCACARYYVGRGGMCAVLWHHFFYVFGFGIGVKTKSNDWHKPNQMFEERI